MVQEDELAEDGLRPVSKGTKFLKVPGMATLMGGGQAQNRSTTQSLVKYEPFFKMLRQDAEHKKGIVLQQYPNPITGVADLVTVTFDLRALQIEDALIQRQTMGLGQMNNNATPPPANNQMPATPTETPQTTNTEPSTG
tara:strand:- start:119 stop:535 length:417 start_codon:yes stop_codon:yes gene_type:complete